MIAQSKHIVVVGSINTDLVVTSERLPCTGETVTGRSFATFQGGKGANQAVAAAQLGAKVSMIGKVGSDSFGAESLRELQRRGVNCEHVHTEPGDSGIAVITVGRDGQNTIVVVPGANALVSPEFIESKRSVIREAGIVLAQLEIPIESVVYLAQLCEHEGVPLMLDPAPTQSLPHTLLPFCEWLTPNETEASFYIDPETADSPEEVAKALHAKGARSVLLKMGDRGAVIDRLSSPAHKVAAFPVCAVDTTAAGDTFNAAFAAALIDGREIEFCGYFASAAAALSVTRAGAQASMPSLGEVKAFLQERDFDVSVLP
jgi:ribokinase